MAFLNHGGGRGSAGDDVSMGLLGEAEARVDQSFTAAASGAERALSNPGVGAATVAPGRKKTPSKHARLASLDIVRGLTMAVMVLVDEIGDAYPSVNHSPWNNVTFADFVMPWFLFMVGTSMAFSLRRYQRDRASRLAGTRAAAVRALKLYWLGVLLQGGGWIGSFSYGYNILTLRWCGILNRIAFAYLVVALAEVWLPNTRASACCTTGSTADGAPAPLEGGSGVCIPHCRLYGRYGYHWLLAVAFLLLHLVVTFATFVPSWQSEYGWNHTLGEPARLAEPFTIPCDVRGSVATPECSAAGFYDRALFGQAHLGVWMSKRLPQCSSCSPGSPSKTYRPDCHYIVPQAQPPPNASTPTQAFYPWCFAQIYDPEGALATVPTVMSTYLGLHFGRATKAPGIAGNHLAVLGHWAVAAAVLVVLGLVS